MEGFGRQMHCSTRSGFRNRESPSSAVTMEVRYIYICGCFVNNIYIYKHGMHGYEWSVFESEELFQLRLEGLELLASARCEGREAASEPRLMGVPWREEPLAVWVRTRFPRIQGHGCKLGNCKHMRNWGEGSIFCSRAIPLCQSASES